MHSNSIFLKYENNSKSALGSLGFTYNASSSFAIESPNANNFLLHKDPNPRFNIFKDCRELIEKIKFHLCGAVKKEFVKVLTTNSLTKEQLEFYASIVDNARGLDLVNLQFTQAFDELMKTKLSADEWNLYTATVASHQKLGIGFTAKHLTEIFAKLKQSKVSKDDWGAYLKIYTAQTLRYKEQIGNKDDFSEAFLKFIEARPSAGLLQFYALKINSAQEKNDKIDINFTKVFTTLVKSRLDIAEIAKFSNQYLLEAKYINKRVVWRENLDEHADAFIKFIATKPNQDEWKLYISAIPHNIKNTWHLYDLITSITKLLKTKPGAKAWDFYAWYVNHLKTNNFDISRFTEQFVGLLQAKPNQKQWRFYTSQVADPWLTNDFTAQFARLIKAKPSKQQWKFYAAQITHTQDSNIKNFTQAFADLLEAKPNKRQWQIFNSKAQTIQNREAFTRIFIKLVNANLEEKEFNTRLNFYISEILPSPDIKDLTKIFDGLNDQKFSTDKNDFITVFKMITELDKNVENFNAQAIAKNHFDAQIERSFWLDNNLNALISLTTKFPLVYAALVNDLQQRKNPNLFTHEISVFNFTFRERNVRLLENMYDAHADWFVNDQRFFLRIARYLKAIDQTKAILKPEVIKSLDSKTACVNFLGETLVKRLVKELDINLPSNINLDNFLASWDLEHLGTLIASSDRWSDDDKEVFKVLVQYALEKRLPELFTNQVDDSASEIVQSIQKSFKRLQKVMQNYSLDYDLWQAAHKHFEPETVIADSAVNYEERFQEIYAKFLQFLASEHQEASVDFAVKPKNFIESKQELPLKLANFVQKYYSGKNLPEAVANLKDTLEDKVDKRSVQTICFADPLDLGFNLFAGNRANSCTALDSNASAIFYLLTDPGTKYILIKNSLDNITGYARVFLSLDRDDKPIIYLDSIDGSAHHFQKAIYKQIKLLAEKTGVEVETIQERDSNFKTKLAGSAFPDRYFDHTGFQVQAS